MNRELYRGAFANVHPSDEALERIINMTKNKKKRTFFRPLIAVAAVLSLLLAGGIIANAATDGSVVEGIAVALDAAEQKFSIMINGKPAEYNELDDSDKEFLDEFEAFMTEAGEEDGKYGVKIEKHDGYETAAIYDASVDGDGELLEVISEPKNVN